MVTYDYDRTAADVDKWKRLEWVSDQKAFKIEQVLKRQYGGIYNAYIFEDPAKSEEANRLRLVLEQHRASSRAFAEKRYPTQRDMEAVKAKLKMRYAKVSSGPWSWKPIPGPSRRPGDYDGYVTQNGRAELRPQIKQTRSGPKKTKEWYLILDGKKHESHSRTPGFGHAEFILQRELGPDYDHARGASHGSPVHRRR